MIYKRFALFTLFLVNIFTHMLRSVAFFNYIRHKFVKPGSLSFVNQSEFTINNKKVITISPGGFKGFYTLGLCKFIKQHYDLTDYLFSGASAGAWNALMLCYKGDINDFEQNVLCEEMLDLHSLNKIENIVKHRILSRYTSDDFELDKLFIGTTVVEKYRLKTNIYGGFETLNDAVDCCIASSHIPFITGGLYCKYNGLLTFDGGFSEYPYLNNTYADIHLTPSIWKGNKSVLDKLDDPNISINDFTTIFSNKRFDILELIASGYHDAELNKCILDKKFHQ